MKIVLSLLIVLIYWFLDAYQDVLNFNISFSEAIFLTYAQATPLIKIVISISIFLLSMITIKPSEKEKPEVEKKEEPLIVPEQLSAMYKISDIVLAPIPLHKQLNSIVEIIEERLKAKTAFIASFDKDAIFLLNTNESLKVIGLKDKYLPHHNELLKQSIDNLLSICFLEKREFLDDIVSIRDIQYRVIIHSCKDNHSKKPIGLLAMVLDVEDKNGYSNFLPKTCEQIAFTINLTKKKDAAIEAQAKYNAMFSSMDTELNIPSNSKLQETIEHEIKRSQRYGTLLSLIVIEVDHMKNLTNIFSDKETLNLQKDIAMLLKRGVRETDLFGKWTNDHFAVVAPDIDFRAAKSFANKLNQMLIEHRFSKVGRVTCSYGITSFSPKDTLGDFRKRAESALKEATSKGGNSIEIKILV